MKKARKRTVQTTPDVATQADAAQMRAQWLQRSHGLLLGAIVMLIVATPLIPSEAAVPFGSHVVLTMLWLVLTAAWLMRCLLDEKPVWHIGITGTALLLFLGLHSLSGVGMIHQGHGRPTLNALWLWCSLGMTFLAVRQWLRRGVQQRALVSVLIAMAVGMSMYGIYQMAYVYPQQRARYEANPDEVLNLAGEYAPVGSPHRRHFEDRLASTEPIGPFALTNSLAGFLTPCLLLLVGIAVPLWHVLRRGSAASNARGGVGRAVSGLAVVALVSVCLLLTKSRSAYLAVLIGIGLLGIGVFGVGGERGVARAVPRFALRWPWLAGGTLILTLLGLSVAFYGGMDRQVLTEAPKSLLYRLQYWQASAAMIKDHPWWGCGPGNFHDYYTHYKLPEASETVADPHNLFVEVAATAGLPALSLFVVVGGAWLWCVWRSQRGSAVSVAEPSADRAVAARHARTVYLGAAAGLLLTYPAGWAGGQSPSPELLWVAFPFAAGSVWVLQPWVLRGNLPVTPLVVAVVALVINLLAAGGIGFPGVAELLWVLAALALNVAELRGGETPSIVSDQPSETCRTDAYPSAGRPVILVAAGGALLLVAACYLTMYRPVLSGQEYTAFLSETMAKRPTTGGPAAELVIQQSREAAAADRWWSEPCTVWAQALHLQWCHRPEPARLKEFEQVSAEAQRRNPQSAGLARRQGDWFMAMYAAASRADLLSKAIEAYARAVSLYPNNSRLHAQLAWAYLLDGDTAQARRAAADALRLDALMPHDELKLKHQAIAGLTASRRGGGPVIAVRGGNPEQLMRAIRKTKGPL